MTIAQQLKKAFDDKKQNWGDSFDQAKEMGTCVEDWEN